MTCYAMVNKQVELGQISICEYLTLWPAYNDENSSWVQSIDIVCVLEILRHF